MRSTDGGEASAAGRSSICTAQAFPPTPSTGRFSWRATRPGTRWPGPTARRSSTHIGSEAVRVSTPDCSTGVVRAALAGGRPVDPDRGRRRSSSSFGDRRARGPWGPQRAPAAGVARGTGGAGAGAESAPRLPHRDPVARRLRAGRRRARSGGRGGRAPSPASSMPTARSSRSSSLRSPGSWSRCP